MGHDFIRVVLLHLNGVDVWNDSENIAAERSILSGRCPRPLPHGRFYLPSDFRTPRVWSFISIDDLGLYFILYNLGRSRLKYIMEKRATRMVKGKGWGIFLLCQLRSVNGHWSGFKALHVIVEALISFQYSCNWADLLRPHSLAYFTKQQGSKAAKCFCLSCVIIHIT